jgi:hypothetical protein
MKKLLLILLLCFVEIIANGQTTTTINVGGDPDKYYPVTFSDAEWANNRATEITIGRSDSHLNSVGAGSAIAKFRYHTIRAGHGSAFIDAELYSTANFFAGWDDVTAVNGDYKIMIWLKGSFTYYMTSNSTIGVDVYDGVANALPYVEPGGSNRTYKTTIDSYVLNNSIILSQNLLARNNGTFLGNVGIGTSTPTERLSVVGNIVANKLLLDQYGVRLWGISPLGGNLIFHSGDAAGNVGIGTATPGAKLEVNGSAIIDGPGNTLTLRKNANNIPALLFQGASSFTLIEAGDNFMKTMIGGNYKTTLLANGNFGIGTESPTEKLAVNGKIRAQEIRVETTNWPDYVFEEGYKQTSLTELAQYIKLHKHLPGVPAAAEVEKNGLALGEMNKVLLKKIEELTLHLIEKEKALTAVKQELKTQNDRLIDIETLLNKLIKNQ